MESSVFFSTSCGIIVLMTEIEEETYKVTISKCAKTGQRLSQVWRNTKTGKMDNPYGPAEIIFHRDSQTPRQEVFWNNGKISRLEQPALTAFDEEGNIRQKSYLVNDELHADYGPSSMFFDTAGEPCEAHYHKNGLAILKVKVIGSHQP